MKSTVRLGVKGVTHDHVGVVVLVTGFTTCIVDGWLWPKGFQHNEPTFETPF